jgi:protein MpaA
MTISMQHAYVLYAFVRGATLTKHLLRPAMAAAAELVPINEDDRIDGFHAKDGLIEDCYEGVLSAPPKVRPKPFEIILETPRPAPVFLREAALVVALRAIIEEYRKFIAYASNL